MKRHKYPRLLSYLFCLQYPSLFLSIYCVASFSLFRRDNQQPLRFPNHTLFCFLNLPNMERIVGLKYKLGRKIGSGSFGEIYLGQSSLFLSSAIHFTITVHFNFLCSHRSFRFRFLLQRRILTPSRSSPSRS